MSLPRNKVQALPSEKFPSMGKFFSLTKYQQQESLIQSGFLLPNLPYIVSSKGKYSESTAIMIHIAELAQKEDMLPQKDNLSHYMNVLNFVSHKLQSFMVLCYHVKDKNELITKYNRELMANTHRFNR